MSEIKSVPIADIRPGPVRHVLTPEQTSRIALIWGAFLEVFPCSLEEAVDNFSRDMHPNREIAIWERMAVVYRAHLPGCKTLEAKKALFGSILTTGGPPAS